MSERYALLREMKKTGLFYEQEMLDDIRRRVRPAELIADVGACVGTHTIFLAGLCECRVLAFEPYPPNLELLRENVELNALGDRVQIFPFALGAARAKGAARVRGPRSLSTAAIEPTPDGSLEVLPLDSLALPDRISLLKIDVEGMEFDVLRGSEAVIRRDGPLIYLESFDQQALDAVHGFLEPLRYALVDCFNATPTFLFARRDSNRVSESDWALDRKFSHRCVDELTAHRRRWREKEVHDRTVARQPEEASAEHRERVCLEQALREAQDDLQRARANLKGTQADIQRAQADLERTRSELREAQSRLQHVEGELAQERERGGEAARRSADERLAELRKRARLERDLGQAQAKLRAAEQHVARLRESLEAGPLYRVAQAFDPLVRARTDPQSRADLRQAWAFDLRARRRPFGHRILPRQGDRAEIERLAAACRRKAEAAPPDVVVSVVCYVRNDAGTLRRALRSILDQSLSKIEVVAVDDASEDDSFDVLDTLLREDGRLRVVRLANQKGLAWAMNYGMTQARGAFIAFHEGHRAAAPHRLLWQLGRMIENGASAQMARAPSGQFVDGLSDLMLAFDPAVIEVGFFDDVQVGFAPEYRRRLKAALPRRHLSFLEEPCLRAFDIPLIKKRKRPKINRAVRLEYLKSAEAWHRRAKGQGDALFRPFPEIERPFEAPDSVLAGHRRLTTRRIANLLYQPRRHEHLLREIGNLLPNVDRIHVYSRLPIERSALPSNPKIRYYCGHALASSKEAPGVSYFVEVEPGLNWMDPSLSREEEVAHRIVGLSRLPADQLREDIEATDKFSLIMTAYNCASTIDRAIDSICDQSYENWELIIVDDGSDDGTPDIARFKAREDDRIRVIGLDENRGPFWCRNVGIQHATGQYIGFQDADDRSLAHRLEMTAAALGRNSRIVAVWSTMHRRDELGRYQIFNGRVFRLGIITLTLRLDFLRSKLGYFDAVRYSGADSELFERVRCVAAADELEFLPLTLYEALQSRRSQTSHPILGFSGSRFARSLRRPFTREAYVEGYRAWHQRVRDGKASGYLEFPPASRPFPAPRELLPGPPAAPTGSGALPRGAELSPVPLPRFVTESLELYRQRTGPFLMVSSLSPAGARLDPRAPLVTVILATNRPSQLQWSLCNFLRQSYPNKELIIVLNSNSFDVTAIKGQTRLFDNIDILSVDEQHNVGFCLNTAFKTARGDIVAKFDDDDYYGASYLAEQVTAVQRTGAWLVGKASCMYYLKKLDRKILRPPDRDNRWARHVSGATFVIRRELCEQIRFREDIVGTVDTAYLAEVQENGYRLYSSSIFNFCVIRGAHSAHNWVIEDEKIINKSHYICDGFQTAVIDGLIDPSSGLLSPCDVGPVAGAA
ncbi:MAG: FkbM family methyltransferase [Geminicoccaceae bacterium]